MYILHIYVSSVCVCVYVDKDKIITSQYMHKKLIVLLKNIYILTLQTRKKVSRNHKHENNLSASFHEFNILKFKLQMYRNIIQLLHDRITYIIILIMTLW